VSTGTQVLVLLNANDCTSVLLVRNTAAFGGGATALTVTLIFAAGVL